MTRRPEPAGYTPTEPYDHQQNRVRHAVYGRGPGSGNSWDIIRTPAKDRVITYAMALLTDSHNLPMYGNATDSAIQLAQPMADGPGILLITLTPDGHRHSYRYTDPTTLATHDYTGLSAWRVVWPDEETLT